MGRTYIKEQEFIFIEKTMAETLQEEKFQNHFAAAAHLEAAAKHHRKASEQFALGNYEKAHKCLAKARSHHYLALEYAGMKQLYAGT